MNQVIIAVAVVGLALAGVAFWVDANLRRIRLPVVPLLPLLLAGCATGSGPGSAAHWDSLE